VDKTADIQAASNPSHQFCTFRISGRLFGVDILNVKEVNSVFTCTPIFHAPNSIEGYVNIRGQIHLVLNLSVLLGFDHKTDTGNKRLVIFKHFLGEPFGAMVDKIEDIVEVPADQIENQRRSKDGSTDKERRRLMSDLVQGICKLKDELLVVLKAECLLSSLEKPSS